MMNQPFFSNYNDENVVKIFDWMCEFFVLFGEEPTEEEIKLFIKEYVENENS